MERENGALGAACCLRATSYLSLNCGLVFAAHTGARLVQAMGLRWVAPRSFLGVCAAPWPLQLLPHAESNDRTGFSGPGVPSEWRAGGPRRFGPASTHLPGGHSFPSNIQCAAATTSELLR